ncbi:HVO_A0114 family putative DNA-binding protein [Methylolobus aquaticus]
MNPRRLTITLQSDWRSALRTAAQHAMEGLSDGTYQGERLNFESPGAFFGKLTEKRWAIVHALQAEGGEMAVRELARRLGRDVKRVHADVCVLAELGLIERTASGGLLCPYADIHVDMHLSTRAA